MNNKKPNLFLDFDGLKYYTFREFAKYYNERYSVDIKAEEFHIEKDAHKLVSSHIQITEKELYDACGTEFLSSIPWHSTVEPYAGLCEVLPGLAKKYTIHTVTARQFSGVNTIQYLNEKYVPGCISQIHCVWKKLQNGEYEHISKIDYILEYIHDGDIFIDDTPKEIIGAQNIVRSILFDPHDVFSGLLDIRERVTSWNQIGELIL